MNRVTVIIEQQHADAPIKRLEISAVFKDADYTANEVLDVFEDALRGAGYHCPAETLNISNESACGQRGERV